MERFVRSERKEFHLARIRKAKEEASKRIREKNNDERSPPNDSSADSDHS